MTLDDESLLTGYLDDELDAAERQAVEVALQADPALADRLRELAGARDLLGALSRPRCPVDLSAAVSSRVERARSSRAMRRRVFPVLISVGAIAASTLAVAFRLPGPAAAPGAAPVAPGGPISVAETKPAAPAATNPAPEPVTPAVEVAQSPTVVKPAAPAPDPATLAQEEDLRKLRDLLSREGVHRVLILTDVIDAPKELARIIEGTARKSADFARIYVHQGLAVDPEHPEEATVFAMVMDGQERRDFLAKIEKFRPADAGVKPEVLAQLGEIQDASWFRGKAAAGLGSPPELPGAMALKAHSLPHGHAIEGQVVSGVETARRPGPAGRKGAESASAASQVAVQPRFKDGAVAGTREPDGPRVVLVWVASRRGDPPGR